MLRLGIGGRAHNRVPCLLPPNGPSSTSAVSTSQRKKRIRFVIGPYVHYTASHTLLQMDWIGDKLSQLIQEGQRALGREVVVASETQEDEVDDGSGAWQEEYPDHDLPKRSSGSICHTKRPHNVHTSHRSDSSSPRTDRFDFQSNGPASMPIPMSMKRGSSQVSPSVGASFTEDESAWDSQELRESMSRARARYLANRG